MNLSCKTQLSPPQPPILGENTLDLLQKSIFRCRSEAFADLFNRFIQSPPKLGDLGGIPRFMQETFMSLLLTLKSVPFNLILIHKLGMHPQKLVAFVLYLHQSAKTRVFLLQQSVKFSQHCALRSNRFTVF